MNPDLRPNAQTLLNNPNISKISRGDDTFSQIEERKKIKLLDTIKCPKNLKLLMGKLPEPQYIIKETNSSSFGSEHTTT